MKKVVLAVLMASMLLVGCGTKTNGYKPESAVKTMEAVWEAHAEDEKFAICGGSGENAVSDAPGVVDVTDVETMDRTLGICEEAAGLLDDGATIVHMMNANTFTAGLYHLTDAKEAENFVALAQDTIENKQWMCGFPEQLVIANVGSDYVFVAYGGTDQVETFKTHLVEVTEAEVVVEQSLM